MNKRGRPRNAIPKRRTSFSIPTNYQNTLQIIRTKLPELNGLSESEQTIKIVEMFAIGDLVITEQYIKRTRE